MVRLILSLVSMNSCSQKDFERKFRSAMKGFIYKRLEESQFSLKETSSGFHFFSFSNLYPIKDAKIEEGKKYSLVITSAIPNLILILLEKINVNDMINLGEGRFSIFEMRLEKPEIFRGCSIEMISPLVIKRMKATGKDNYVNFDKEKEEFKRILGINLVKRYNEIRKKDLPIDYPVFENIEIKPLIKKSKGHSNFSLIIEDYDDERKGKPIYFYGNRLEFQIGKISQEQQEIFQIGFLGGFGSACSYGCGYGVIRGD